MRASVLITITHPSISIDSLSNSVDFRICPMPLGQQSNTPLAFHRVSTFSTHYSICPGLSLTPVPNSAGLHTQSVCPSTWFANPPTFQIRSIWHPHPIHLSVRPADTYPPTYSPTLSGLHPSVRHKSIHIRLSGPGAHSLTCLSRLCAFHCPSVVTTG